jgi:hypothetical protein
MSPSQLFTWYNLFFKFHDIETIVPTITTEIPPTHKQKKTLSFLRKENEMAAFSIYYCVYLKNEGIFYDCYLKENEWWKGTSDGFQAVEFYTTEMEKGNNNVKEKRVRISCPSEIARSAQVILFIYLFIFLSAVSWAVCRAYRRALHSTPRSLLTRQVRRIKRRRRKVKDTRAIVLRWKEKESGQAETTLSTIGGMRV